CFARWPSLYLFEGKAQGQTRHTFVSDGIARVSVKIRFVMLPEVSPLPSMNLMNQRHTGDDLDMATTRRPRISGTTRQGSAEPGSIFAESLAISVVNKVCRV
ncbi:MAG: hypothetical protein V4632_08125, partial [Pseudomonadota bacterium]